MATWASTLLENFLTSRQALLQIYSNNSVYLA